MFAENLHACHADNIIIIIFLKSTLKNHFLKNAWFNLHFEPQKCALKAIHTWLSCRATLAITNDCLEG